MPLDFITHPAPPISPIAAALPAPPILTCRAWAARYVGEHGPVIDLTQAVPGWPPPEPMLRKLAAAGGDPRLTGYGPLQGEPELRAAFAEETGLLYGGDVAATDVAITAGANVAFNLAAMVLAAPGERMLVPAPWFFNHPLTLALRQVGVVALPCHAADGYLPDPERAAALLDPSVRAIVLVSPNNPTGAVLPPALIERFAALCRDRALWLVLDETYRDFRAEPGPAHDLFQRDDWRDFLVQVYSFSKAYSLPGHRVGAVVAGPAVLEAMLKAADNVQICPPRPPQAALAWAIPELRDWRAVNRTRIASRAGAFNEAIAAAPGWQVDASGAYFAWVRVPADAGGGARAARALAEERGVIALPGSVFGPGGGQHVRLAFAAVDAADCAALPERLRGLAAAARP